MIAKIATGEIEETMEDDGKDPRTTSGYGRAAYEFANGKPIELISGSNLLYLLKEHSDIDAKIEIPDDWVDTHYPIVPINAFTAVLV
jgi:restriction system protein